MATWHTTESAAAAWAGAPDNAVLAELLDVAKAEVIAYAPALPEVEPPTTGTIVPGPITETRRNLFLDPAASGLSAGFVAGAGQTTLSYVGSAVRWTIVTTAVVGINTAPPATVVGGINYRLLLRARANRPVGVRRRIRATETPTDITLGTAWQWIDYTAVANPGGANSSTGLVLRGTTHVVNDWIEIDRVLVAAGTDTGDWFGGSSPDRIDGGRTYDYAWLGAENQSASVETYRPDVWVPDAPLPQEIPESYRWAHLAHARNVWNAAQVNPSGGFGSDEGSFMIRPFPLDWSIKQRLRPARVFGGDVA